MDNTLDCLSEKGYVEIDQAAPITLSVISFIPLRPPRLCGEFKNYG
jgi:hypothetical protein